MKRALLGLQSSEHHWNLLRSSEHHWNLEKCQHLREMRCRQLPAPLCSACEEVRPVSQLRPPSLSAIVSVGMPCAPLPRPAVTHLGFLQPPVACGLRPGCPRATSVQLHPGAACMGVRFVAARRKYVASNRPHLRRLRGRSNNVDKYSSKKKKNQC